MYRVDITADLNDEDHTGYLWTFLDEARVLQPAVDLGLQGKAAAKAGLGDLVGSDLLEGHFAVQLLVAGDEDAAAVCQVIDLVPAGDGTIVHLRPLPGLVDDYRALVERALAS